MQNRFSEEFKDSVIQKMMPPNAVSVSQLCRDTGVSDATLYKWRKDYRNRGIYVPSDKTKPNQWTAEDKLAAIIETAALNEAELSEYYRKKGRYVDQLKEWKVSALSGYQQNEKNKKETSRNRQE